MVPTMFRLPCDCSTGPQTENGLEPDLSKTLPQKLWNNLPDSILKVESVEGFMRRLETFHNPDFSLSRSMVLFFCFFCFSSATSMFRKYGVNAALYKWTSTWTDQNILGVQWAKLKYICFKTSP